MVFKVYFLSIVGVADIKRYLIILICTKFVRYQDTLLRFFSFRDNYKQPKTESELLQGRNRFFVEVVGDDVQMRSHIEAEGHTARNGIGIAVES